MKGERKITPEDNLCFYGHTHIPTVIRIDTKDPLRYPVRIHLKTTTELREDSLWVVNPGSVGQPRNQDSRASYCILEETDKGRTITYHYIGYDIDKVKAKIKEAKFPEVLGKRLEFGK